MILKFILFYLFCSDDQQYIYKDAIVLSPHKFLGGPGCPGVLIAKKKLFVNPVPAQCGGGTVFFVRREHHTYLKEVSHLKQCWFQRCTYMAEVTLHLLTSRKCRPSSKLFKIFLTVIVVFEVIFIYKNISKCAENLHTLHIFVPIMLLVLWCADLSAWMRHSNSVKLSSFNNTRTHAAGR